MIRETNEKSFRTLLNIINDSSEEFFIINESLQLLYYNNQFVKRLTGLISSVPHTAKEFIHADSFDNFKGKTIACIKNQSSESMTVQLTYKTDELGGKFNWYNFNIGLFETYESNIKPIFWKGSKAAVVSLRCIENQKAKEKLLINQSNEISSKFEEMIKMIQDELLEDDGRSENSASY